jgi:FtsP/CotA-like multicopper oxidase with cupredoxin domain
MHSLSAARGRHPDSPFSRRVIGAIAALSMCGCLAALAQAQEATSKANPPPRAEFREPVTLASRDGVLEVRLTARQGTARLDTVATPVKNFFVFDYQLIRGTPSDGQMSGGNLYPAPTLQVFPGETLIVHLENGLSGLTISGLLQSAIHAEGRDSPDLSGATDLIAIEPSRSRGPHQPERQCR